MISRTVLTWLQHYLPSPLHPLTVLTLEGIVLGRRPHLPQHIHQYSPHHLLPMQHLLIRYLHLEMHPYPLMGIRRGTRLDPAQQGSKWTTSLRVESRGINLLPASYPLRRRFGRIERGFMGISWGQSHWRTRRKSLPLVHHLPQRTKQRRMEGGARRSCQPRQCPEGCGRG